MNNTLSEGICIIQNGVVPQLTSSSSGLLVSCNLLTPFWQNVKPRFCIPQGTTDKSEAGNNFVCTLYASFLSTLLLRSAKFLFLLYVVSDVARSASCRFSSQLQFGFSFCFHFGQFPLILLSIEMVTSCLLLISYLIIAAGDNRKKNYTNYVIYYFEGNYYSTS